MGTWSKRVILVCGVVAVGCGGKDSTQAGTDAAPDLGTVEARAEVCQPNCDGKECGDDGCGGDCGTCAEWEACSDVGVCECVPRCQGKDCGPDYCGGTCGVCVPGVCCIGGICCCVPEKNCEGRECGDDGCGGVCGTCEPGFHCNLEYQCVPDGAPDCAGKQCGSDSAGGSCGTCPCDECDPAEVVCNAETFQCEKEIPKDCKWIFACMETCPEGDQACHKNCFDEAEPAAQTDYQSLLDCIEELGYDVCGWDSGEDYEACMEEQFKPCLDDYYQCFHGDLTSDEMKDCFDECPDVPEGQPSPCISDCWSQGTVAAQKAYQAIIDCLDENGYWDCTEADEKCIAAAEAACQTEFDACFPPGTLTCKEIFDCMDTCAPTDQACFSTCYQSGNKEAQAEFGAIADCVAAECGEESTSGCEDTALAGACAEAYALCMGE